MEAAALGALTSANARKLLGLPAEGAKIERR